MPSIRQLSPDVVNQIAAGEVIERPASVVKELMENSVDAGARRVEVALAKGGAELIQVTDDGHGVPVEELPLAVISHATSKLQSADDLFRVRTLGFRGEALASIASVSRLTIRSRTSDAAAAAELRIDAGRSGQVKPAAGPPGTTVEVRDLFLNTPVRRKFLRTVQTEFGHATESFTRIALANPQMHFTLRHNGRVVHELPPCAESRERIATFFGADLAESLIEVASEDGSVRLHGYVANPMHSRANNRLQYLFLNGRCIRDRSLQHALSEAYRGLLLTGRYPICFLRLEMPPDEVDVNVHPTKLEVRFQDSGRLYSQLLGTLRTKFLTVDLKARGQGMGGASEPASTIDASAGEQPSQLVAWAKAQLEEQKGAAAVVQASKPPEDDPQGVAAEPLRLVPLTAEATVPPATAESSGWSPEIVGVTVPRDESSTHVRQDSATSSPGAPASARVAGTQPFARGRALQVHNRYLIAETEDGLEVIDQHALHERILYEQIREKVLAGPLESQRLLVPEPVDLPPAEAAAVLEHRDLLHELGVEIEPFGGDTVLVASYPAMLANMRPTEVLRGLIEQLMEGSKAPDRRDLLDKLLNSVACKAAVKYGDYLAPEEIDALLSQRHLAQDHHHCPHGRPTALVFTREDLDRQFKRI